MGLALEFWMRWFGWEAEVLEADVVEPVLLPGCDGWPLVGAFEVAGAAFEAFC